METNTCSAGEGDAHPSASELAALLETVRQADRLLARAAVMAGRLAGSGVAERVEGLPLDLLLGVAAGWTGADRHTLVTAGEVLRDLPTLAALFSSGSVSWGVVRAVVRGAKRMSRSDRQALDRRLARTLDRDGALLEDPDRLVDAIDRAIDDLSELRRLERREQRRVRNARLWVRSDLYGGVDFAGGFPDPVQAAVFTNALQAAADRPRSAEPAVDGEDAGGRAGQLAEGLQTLCDAYLAGDTPRRARAAFTVRVDLDDEAGATPALVDQAVAAAPARITARRAEEVAEQGASVRTVAYRRGTPVAVSEPVRLEPVDTAGGSRPTTFRLSGRGFNTVLQRRDLGPRRSMPLLRAAAERALATSRDLDRLLAGTNPLCEPAKTHADDIPTPTRVAVTHRDQGCTFPGCRAPSAWSDVHHIVERERGGDHHPDRLLLLCRRHHVLVHRHGWQLHHDPLTGVITIHRRHRVWRTRPRGTALAPSQRPPPRATAPARTTVAADPSAGPERDADLPF